MRSLRHHLPALIGAALLLSGSQLQSARVNESHPVRETPALSLSPEWQAVETTTGQRIWMKAGTSAVITLSETPADDQTSALGDAQWADAWQAAQTVKQRALAMAGLRNWQITSRRMVGTGPERHMIAAGSYLNASSRRVHFIEVTHARHALLYSEERATPLPRAVEAELLAARAGAKP